MGRRILYSIGCFAFVGLVGGCTAIVGGQIDDAQLNPNDYRDVRVQLEAFAPHLTHDVSVAVTESGTPTSRIWAFAVLQPLVQSCVVISFPNGAPLRAERIDFWADQNANGVLDPFEGADAVDHAWRRPLDPSGFLLFAHDFNFDNIAVDDPPLPAQGSLALEITGLEAFNDMTLVGSVIAQVSTQPVDAIVPEPAVVGVFRQAPISDSQVRTRLIGIIDRGNTYELELGFGDPPTQTCVFEDRAPDAGDFEVSIDFTDLGCEDREPEFEVVSDCDDAR